MGKVMNKPAIRAKMGIWVYYSTYFTFNTDFRVTSAHNKA